MLRHAEGKQSFMSLAASNINIDFKADTRLRENKCTV